MNKKERHFFLEDGRKRSYCVEYLPDEEKKKDCCVVLCRSIWGERIRTHRIFTNVARTLRDHGFSVATCDYFGDGNSGGETKDLGFVGMVEDAQRLSTYLMQKAEVEKVALVGLRFGANVAIGAEPNIPGVCKLVLFEPIADPCAVLKEWLRANLSSQMAIHKKIIKTRNDLIEDLKNGEFVNVDGFLIGKDFWESFEAVSPFQVKSDFSGPVSFYSLVPKGRKPADFSGLSSGYPAPQLKHLESEFIWTGWKQHVPKPPLFIEAVVSELVGEDSF